jgi:hypothetical protein
MVLTGGHRTVAPVTLITPGRGTVPVFLMLYVYWMICPTALMGVAVSACTVISTAGIRGGSPLTRLFGSLLDPNVQAENTNVRRVVKANDLILLFIFVSSYVP